MNDINRLIVDFDGTLVNTVKKITELYNEDFCAYKKFKKIDWLSINSWDFDELSCANKEYVNTYFNQPRFFDGLEFMPGAVEALWELKNVFNDIIVVSMGYSPNLRLKKFWMKEYLPDIKFVGCNFKKYPDKSHIDMRGDFILDDSSKNLHTSNASTKICYGLERAWNYDWEGTRCKNWNDFIDYIYEGVIIDGFE